jgi:hypothetical protein
MELELRRDVKEREQCPYHIAAQEGVLKRVLMFSIAPCPMSSIDGYILK